MTSRSYRDSSRQKQDDQRRDPRGVNHDKTRAVTIKPNSRAFVQARTVYPHTVVAEDFMPLKTGHNNTKIGRKVTKGRLKGAPIYCLTLEERDTCPRSCRNWLRCFGNVMLYAKRIAPGPTLEDALDNQLGLLQRDHPNGFLVRLHVLGDFYSVEYALKWRAWLDKYPALHVYGYTAWPKSSAIGEQLFATMMHDWERFSLRFSDAGMERDSTVTIETSSSPRGAAVICPAQTHDDVICATCALCWETRRNIAFIAH